MEFLITTAITPKRDIDLFGETTVMVQSRRDPDSAGVPVLYVSPYVSDPMAFAQRCAAALAWLDGEATFSPPARAGDAPNKPSPEAGLTPNTYAMPDFAEDVDWSEALHLADPVDDTDWKAWAAAVERRIRLATTGEQLAALEVANPLGFRACPARYRISLGRSLFRALQETEGQLGAAA